jgi:Xaa-Pro aminopeptidase
MKLKKTMPLTHLFYAASEKCADLFYATRFSAPDPFLLIIHRGKKIMVTSDLELDRARRQAQVEEVISLQRVEQELMPGPGSRPTMARVIQHLLKKKKVTRVQIPFDFPSGLAFELTRMGIHFQVNPVSFFEEREIKSPRELRSIVETLRVAEKGMEEAAEILRESREGVRGVLFWREEKLTAEILKQAINRIALETGCSAVHTIVACGEQGCDPHEEGAGPILASQPIIIDIFPRSIGSGYWGDITRTFLKGKASPPLQAMYRAVQAAQKLAIQMLRPGICGKEIHEAVLESFKARGFQTGLIDGKMQGFFHGTGHGVGLEIHELPRIGPQGLSPLQAGQIVTIEPGLYYRGLGGVRLEDLLLITETGSRNLTRFPKAFELV